MIGWVTKCFMLVALISIALQFNAAKKDDEELTPPYHSNGKAVAVDGKKHPVKDDDEHDDDVSKGHGKKEKEILQQEEDFFDWMEEYKKTGKAPKMNDNVQKIMKSGKASPEKIAKMMNKNNGNSKDNGRKKRAFMYMWSNIWTKCIIPYTIDSSFLIESPAYDSAMNGLYWAMDEYEHYTGFRFVDYTGNNLDYELDHTNFLSFVNDTGCWSYVGNVGSFEGQDISPCTYATAVHEIGHAIGLMHENRNPLAMFFERTVFPEIKPDYRDSYFRSSFRDVPSGNIWYDPSSLMHYYPWTFDLNNGDTMQMFDEDDNYLLDAAKDSFYMFEALQSSHNCYAEYPSCSTPPSCMLGGYVSVIDGVCQCRCPDGLDMGTNCASERTPDATNWPAGVYSTFMTSESGGNCPSGWESGSMVQWPYKSVWKGSSYMSPPYNGWRTQHDVCTKTDSTGTINWPPGRYCLLRYGETCPTGFSVGTVRTSGEDPRSDVTNTGTLPSGNHGKEFEYIFCCRNDGSANTDLEGISIREPLILFPTTWTCQSVADTQNVREFFVWKNNDTIAVETSGTLPKIYKFDPYTFNMYFCVYFPLMKGYGEIKTFTTETSYSFSSPNYPNTSPQSYEMYWRYESPPGTIMQLDFVDFNIPPNANGVCKTTLEIRNWYPGIEGYQFCSSTYKKTWWTQANYLTVKLTTDAFDAGNGFNATIKIIPENDKTCYQYDGSGGVYAGTMDYTRNFATCLPWDEVGDCPYNAFDRRVVNEDLTGHNHCRNVGVGTGPWCYHTKDECRRHYCDACQRGTCFDLFDDCQAKIMNDADFCSKNVYGEAARGCRATCGMCASPRANASTVSCGAPPDVGTIAADSSDTTFSVGDTVNYTCPQTGIKQIRTCTSEGTWTELNVICGVCPTGWIVFNKKCYKWLGVGGLFTHADAVSYCARLVPGGRLPTIQDLETEIFLQEAVDYDKDDPGKIWLGISRDESGQWVNENDNTPLTYENWKTQQSYHDCVITDVRYDSITKTHSPVWKSKYCSDYYNTICELELPDSGASSSCVDRRTDCVSTLTKTGDLCTAHPDYAWHNCRNTCGFDACKDMSTTCTDDAILGSPGTRIVGTDTIGHGELVEYVCTDGYHLTDGNLKRTCLSTGSLTGVAPVCSSIASLDAYTINSEASLRPRPTDANAGRIVLANNGYSIASLGGVILSWSFYSNAVGEIAFVVLRPTTAVALGSTYTNVEFTVVGLNTIAVTDNKRIMQYIVPVGENIDIQSGDFVGIYHKNYEISYSKCQVSVMPEHGHWMVSTTTYSDVSALPTVGTSVMFDGESKNCRRYSLQYALDP